MSLELVTFGLQDVTVVRLTKAERLLARLLTTDVSKLSVGAVGASVMLNATGGVIGLPWVCRTSMDAYELILLGPEADAIQAWVRQVNLAFEAEVEVETLQGFYFVGKMPTDGLVLNENQAVEMEGVRFMNMGWISLVAGAAEVMTAMHRNLRMVGARKGEQTGFDALRILARQPAMGLEIVEGSSPLEVGLEALVDFSNAERIFIGRALTEARAQAGNYLRMQLIAFDVAFDPSHLTDVPNVRVNDNLYSLTSIARIPEGPFTVGLVRLPSEVEIGSKVSVEVKTDPAVVCGAALVIDRQI